MWQALVDERFGNTRSPAVQRQRLLAIAVGTEQIANSRPSIPRAELRQLTHELVECYAGKTVKTLSRDLTSLERRELLVRSPGHVAARSTFCTAYGPTPPVVAGVRGGYPRDRAHPDAKQPGPGPGRECREPDRQQDRLWWIPSGPITGGGVVPSLALGWSHTLGAQRSEVVPCGWRATGQRGRLKISTHTPRIGNNCDVTSSQPSPPSGGELLPHPVEKVGRSPACRQSRRRVEFPVTLHVLGGEVVLPVFRHGVTIRPGRGHRPAVSCTASHRHHRGARRRRLGTTPPRRGDPRPPRCSPMFLERQHVVLKTHPRDVDQRRYRNQPSKGRNR